MENGEKTPHDDQVRVANVKLCVESTCRDGRGLVEQICPALLIRSQKAIPKVAKHIYNHLAAHSCQGIPDIIISLIPGENIINLQVINRLYSYF